MEDMIIYVAVSLVISAVVGRIGYGTKLLTSGGSTAAFLLCTLIGAFGSPNMLALFLVYAIAEIYAVRIGNCHREDAGLDFEERGERGFWDITRMMIAPLIIATMDLVWQDNDGIVAIAFVTSITVLAACTMAKEFGVKDTRVWNIMPPGRGEPGIAGTISMRGALFAVVSIAISSIIGSIIVTGSMDRIWVPMICGTMGSLIDLIIGATLVRKGLIGDDLKDSLSCIIGGLIAITFCLAL